MNNENTRKSCTNCKYFYQHYVMGKTHIRKVNCGHCTKKTLTPKDKRSFPFANGCELWQAYDKRDERIKSIEAVIRDMENHLREIKQILKTEL